MKATYIDHMGTDLSVVNAARVSFGKRSDWEYDIQEQRMGDMEWVPIKANKRLSDRDTKLIQFLARGCTLGDWDQLLYEIGGAAGEEHEALVKHVKNMPTHWTPFGHTAITLHIKAPIFVARQLGKHQVGMVWNEVSRRYVTDEPELYRPTLRERAENVKQGSSDTEVDDTRLYRAVHDSQELAAIAYSTLILNGVCPEQARMVLPQSMYTEWYWTGNLYAFANVFNQRTDSHAQREVQVIAKQVGEIISPLFPVSWEALTQ